MNGLPRCDRGHFLPTTAQPGQTCHHTRYHSHREAGSDLWGQGRHVYGRSMTTIQLTGSYL
jgi:hypothetical protein